MAQDRWISDLGKLILRRVVRPHGHEELTLAYRDKATDEIHYRTVVEERHGQGTSHFADYLECMQQQHEEHAGVGSFHLGYATDADIDRMVMAWKDRHIGLEEWLANIKQYEPALLSAEVDRIQQAIIRNQK